MSYRFECRIVDEATGEVVERDQATLTDTCESARIAAAQMLHNWQMMQAKQPDHYEDAA